MSLASSARQALGRFTHLAGNRPIVSAKSTPAKADDKDEKASDDDKEKAEDGEEKCEDDDDKEKADDGDKDKNPVDEKAADDDEKDKDKDKDAKKAARSATQAERARWTTVLSHKNSAGRIEAACELLADKTANHSAESIVRILGTLPAAAANKPSGLGERMSTVSTPKVGADAGGAVDPTTPAGLAAQIIANQDRARGYKRAG